MKLQRIAELKLAEPFRAFYLLLADGRKILVDAPDRIGVAPDGSRMGVECGNEMVVLSPDKVRAVDVFSTSQASAK